jgi:predicted permease
MSSNPVSDPVAARRRVRSAGLAGMTGASAFVIIFTLDGWLTPAYSPAGMFVSELSLGPQGWVQILNFVLTGTLIVMFGRGLGYQFRTGPASRAGPILMVTIGVSLIASGPFTTDPSAIVDQSSIHGMVHGVFGAIVFTLAPLSCYVFYRRFRIDQDWRDLAGWTLASGLVLTVGIGVLKFSQQPGSALYEWKGLVQRILLVILMTWIFVAASRLRRTAGVAHRPNAQEYGQ